MPKKPNYADYSKDELIAEITELKKRKKYGLVWDEEREPEKVVTQCKKELPVLKEVKSKAIQSNPDKPTHILIEGDNYHALSVLNYTHQNAIDVIYIDPPYNTGARDWKYNNNFVDNNDMYRHSKWLSFMNNRLTIAKNLLKDDGVLICAIDENEQSHLGVLLEGLFHSHEIHLVSIVHNPRGIQGKNFSYTNEFAYFVIPKGEKIIGNRKIKDDEIKWSKLRNWGGESLREDARNCFYPIKINPTTKEITGFGDVCDDEFNPESANVKNDGEIWIYPIDNNGIERKWRYARQSVEGIKDFLRAKKTRNIWQIEIGKNFGAYRTVWQDSRYDSNEYGTQLIKKMVPDCDFDFPKSIYNTYDCIYAIIGERKNAIVLDYFAGSGTTGHATLLLNQEDGGNRQVILCTNNENGIAQDVTYPRMKSAINGYDDENNGFVDGIDSNLKYFKTTFVPAKSTDRNKEKLTKQSVEMLCLKENTYESVLDSDKIKIFKNNDHYTGILFDEEEIPNFKEQIKDYALPISVYVFSLGDDDFSEEFSDLRDKVKVCSIPAAILRVYKRIFR